MNEVYQDFEYDNVEVGISKVATYGTLERTMLKVLEENTELNEVLLKTITKPDNLKPSIDKIIEEAGDVLFRLAVLIKRLDIEDAVGERFREKTAQVVEWVDKQNK